MKPRRIQIHRRKGGWRKDHPDAVVVARPSKWGNPFTISACLDAGFAVNAEQARADCVRYFKEWLSGSLEFSWHGGDDLRQKMLSEISELRGKELGCWCPLDQPCHADVLLEIANQSKSPAG